MLRLLKLFNAAAKRGYLVAQNNLALMYANGQGVARDYVWAYAWLDVASAQNAAAASLRDRIAKELTAGQVARAKEIAGLKRRQINKRAGPTIRLSRN